MATTPRDPSHDTAIRSDILNQAQRMLVTLNAGGALALLALVQSVWNDWPSESLNSVLNGVLWLLGGAIVVPVVGVIRYINNLRPSSSEPFLNPVWYFIMALYVASGSCFVVGVYNAVDGGFVALEAKADGGKQN